MSIIRIRLIEFRFAKACWALCQRTAQRNGRDLWNLRLPPPESVQIRVLDQPAMTRLQERRIVSKKRRYSGRFRLAKLRRVVWRPGSCQTRQDGQTILPSVLSSLIALPVVARQNTDWETPPTCTKCLAKSVESLPKAGIRRTGGAGFFGPIPAFHRTDCARRPAKTRQFATGRTPAAILDPAIPSGAVPVRAIRQIRTLAV